MPEEKVQTPAGDVVRWEWARPGVALVTLNRPESLNSMTRGLVDDLSAVLAEIERDSAAGAVVLTGAGRGFSSGHDLGDLGGEAHDADIDALMDNQQAFSGLISQIRELRVPVIAAVNGPAAGGGLAMALAADTRVCSASARFNSAFIRIGISGCDVGVSYLLPRIVGPTLAFEMMLTGRLIDADEALHSGLVLRVLPDGEVVDAALEIAEAIVANSAFGVQMTKQLMWAHLDAPSLRHAILAEDRTQTLCLLTEDAREAIPAMLEARRSR
jgi:enoyl-CoA hydratase